MLRVQTLQTTTREPSYAEVAEPLVVCRSLVRRYSGSAAVPALNGATLEVWPGEWVAIMGSSGSGKSTLLNMVAGLDVPDQGEVLIDSEIMSSASRTRRAQLRRTRIGIVLQSLNLLSDLTASQNVELALRLGGQTKRQARNKAHLLLSDFDLGDLTHRFPTNYPADNSNVSPSPEPWPTNPRSSWPTNQPAHSIATVPRKYSMFFAEPMPKAKPSSWLPTTIEWPATPIEWLSSKTAP
jgi:ABC transporter